MAHPEPHSKILRQSDDLRVKTHINLHSVPGEGDKRNFHFFGSLRGYAGTALVSPVFKLLKKPEEVSDTTTPSLQETEMS
jgi:hypothetical protein